MWDAISIGHFVKESGIVGSLLGLVAELLPQLGKLFFEKVNEELIPNWREKLHEAIKPILPSLDVFGNKVTGDGNRIFFEFLFPAKNRLLKDSPYYIVDTPLEFIHFTSLKNLFSMIREKAIRLYCLKNQKDIYEFEFAATTNGITDQGIIDIKKQFINIFYLTESKNTSNEFHWRNFGHDGKGVWIKFEFDGYENWRNFYLSKVDYNSTNHFLPVFKRINEINQSGKGQVSTDLTDLLSFHKRRDYYQEEETRLLFSSSKEVYSDFLSAIKVDADPNGNLVYYYSLPLKTGKSMDDYLETPVVSIKEIGIGHNIPSPNDVIDKLRHEILSSLNYSVQFSVSSLPVTI